MGINVSNARALRFPVVFLGISRAGLEGVGVEGERGRGVEVEVEVDMESCG